MNQQLWAPSPERIQKTLLSRFIKVVGEQQHRTFADYDDLWQWSVDELEAFWSALWDFCGVVGDRTDEVLHNKADLFNSEFFPDAKLNYAENLLQGAQHDPVLIFAMRVGRGGKQHEKSC